MLRNLLGVVSSVYIIASPALAAPIAVEFNRLVDSDDGFSILGTPAINNNGDVLFTSGNAVTVIENGFRRTIVEGEPGLDAFDFASFNNNGDVIIRAFSSIGTINSLLLASNGSVQTLITDRQDFSAFGAPAINDAGEIAFVADNGRTGNPFVEQVVVRGINGAFEVVESPGNPFAVVVGPTRITNDGDIIYFGRFANNNVALVIEDRNGRQTIIAETGVDIPGFGEFQTFLQNYAVNGNGDIVFAALGSGATPDSLFLYRDGVLTRVEQERGFIRAVSGPSINNLGDISFLTLNSDGTTSLRFLDSEGQLGTVLTTGETLDDLVIRFISTSANALNDDRNLVFRIEFEDGSSALYSASITSIPLPAGAFIFVAGLFFLKSSSKRLK